MRKAAHRLTAYLRHDLREIVNPTSLPNPPEYVPPEKFSWTEIWRVVQEANRKYRESWQSKEQPKDDNKSINDPTNSSLKDDLSQTARAAMQRGQGLKPVLQHIYETRARSYRDAVQEFVEGYKEGYVGQPEAQSSSQKSDPDDTSKPQDLCEAESKGKLDKTQQDA